MAHEREDRIEPLEPARARPRPLSESTMRSTTKARKNGRVTPPPRTTAKSSARTALCPAHTTNGITATTANAARVPTRRRHVSGSRSNGAPGRSGSGSRAGSVRAGRVPLQPQLHGRGRDDRSCVRREERRGRTLLRRARHSLRPVEEEGHSLDRRGGARPEPRPGHGADAQADAPPRENRSAYRTAIAASAASGPNVNSASETTPVTGGRMRSTYGRTT